MFAVRGTFRGAQAVIRWESGTISGDKEVVDAYWKLERQESGKRSYGLHPDVRFSQYHCYPLSVHAIFHEIMPDSVIVEGKEFRDSIIGVDDPPGAIY